jgi:hypothetical protein
VPGAAGYSQFEAAGVVVLETNRLFGGDSSYYYTGSYVGKNGRLTARVEVKHYAGPANSILVGGSIPSPRSLRKRTIMIPKIRIPRLST